MLKLIVDQVRNVLPIYTDIFSRNVEIEAFQDGVESCLITTKTSHNLSGGDFCVVKDIKENIAITSVILENDFYIVQSEINLQSGDFVFISGFEKKFAVRYVVENSIYFFKDDFDSPLTTFNFFVLDYVLEESYFVVTSIVDDKRFFINGLLPLNKDTSKSNISIANVFAMVGFSEEYERQFVQNIQNAVIISLDPNFINYSSQPSLTSEYNSYMNGGLKQSLENIYFDIFCVLKVESGNKLSIMDDFLKNGHYALKKSVLYLPIILYNNISLEGTVTLNNVAIIENTDVRIIIKYSFKILLEYLEDEGVTLCYEDIIKNINIDVGVR